MKREAQIKERSRFCKLALTKPKQAAQELRDLATGLENCKNIADTVQALKTIFAVSERTIFNDFVK